MHYAACAQGWVVYVMNIQSNNRLKYINETFVFAVFENR